jgi:hypothetical protein
MWIVSFDLNFSPNNMCLLKLRGICVSNLAVKNVLRILSVHAHSLLPPFWIWGAINSNEDTREIRNAWFGCAAAYTGTKRESIGLGAWLDALHEVRHQRHGRMALAAFDQKTCGRHCMHAWLVFLGETSAPRSTAPTSTPCFMASSCATLTPCYHQSPLWYADVLHQHSRSRRREKEPKVKFTTLKDINVKF